MKQSFAVLITSILALHLSAQTTFLGLSIENTGRDTFVRPFDSNNPKCILKITNTANQSSMAAIRMSVDVPQAPSALNGIAAFPNGGNLVQLEPEEVTYVSCWTRGLWESTGVPIGATPVPFDLQFSFKQGPQTAVHTRTVYVAQMPLNAAPPAGSLPIAGNIYLPTGSTGNLQVSFGTAFHQRDLLNIPAPANGNLAFSTSLDPAFAYHRQWFIQIKGESIRDTMVAINAFAANNLEITVEKAGILPAIPAYTLLIPPVQTHTGFWRGAASESEATVAFFPGQENWQMAAGCPDSALLNTCKLYKYDYSTGQQLWEHETGWQTWGGDMSEDGQYVAYLIETGHFGSCYVPSTAMRLLDGSNGQLIWEKTGGQEIEGKELKISHNNQYICVGTATGSVIAYDLADGNMLWRAPTAQQAAAQINFGQVRKLLFTQDDAYVYAGSGDNYLRKIRMSDGAVLWRTYVGGWPFVNGLSFNPDETFIAVGTKSCDMNWIRCSDGQKMWSFETGNFEDAVVSPDGRWIAAFSGFVFDTETGLPITRNESATSAFSANSRYLIKLPNQLRFFTANGESLGQTNESAVKIGLAPGSQSQWSFVSSDGQYAIIAGRDMGVNGGNLPAQGIVFYKSIVSGSVDIAGENRFEVYPNPFDNQVFIKKSELCPADLSLQFNLFDLQGRLIRSGQVSGEMRIQMEGLSAGLYSLELLNKDGYRSVFKLVKN